MRRTELARSCFRPSLGGQFDRARFASVALRSTNDDARSWLIVIACPAGWGGTAAEGPSVDRNATANRTENTLGLPLRCEAEAATSSPTLRPRREVLPPSESTHACDHATFSEDPCGPICGSRASPSSSARIRSMIPVDDPSKWVELRTRRWSPPPIPRWNRERQHLSYCPRVDPKLSRRFPSAQTLDLSCVTFYPAQTAWPAGRFSEGFLLRRLS
jgi:hypothetical protein